MAGLIGAIARMMETSTHRAHDDVAAGVVIKHRMSPEYAEKKASDKLLAELLTSGLSPDDIQGLLG